MWCRKRIDIAWSDLAVVFFASLFSRDRPVYEQAIEKAWPGGDRAIFPCLSVRSGWDLLLTVLDLPAGSEVLMSAMTIPDMASIVSGHGLVPVPLELDPALAAPTPETLRQAITPRSRVVLIAHLFGNRVDLNPHITIAREHDLLFIEDCAEAYAGPQFAGHLEADVSMFSFGTIKTGTALGGGLLHLRDRELCKVLQEFQSAYPLQSRSKYLKRILKYAGLKLLSTYAAFGLFVRVCRGLGVDPNEMLNRSVRGFVGTEARLRFRLQASAPLLALLARRLSHFQPRRIHRQQRLGDRLLEKIQPVANCPGSGAGYHHFWVFPVLTDRPSELMDTLRQAGFDATQGESMRIVPKPADSPAIEPVIARDLLKRMVYVPMYPELTDRAAERLAEVLLKFFEEHPPSETERVQESESTEPLRIQE